MSARPNPEREKNVDNLKDVNVENSNSEDEIHQEELELIYSQYNDVVQAINDVKLKLHMFMSTLYMAGDERKQLLEDILKKAESDYLMVKDEYDRKVNFATMQSVKRRINMDRTLDDVTVLKEKSSC